MLLLDEFEIGEGLFLIYLSPPGSFCKFCDRILGCLRRVLDWQKTLSLFDHLI